MGDCGSAAISAFCTMLAICGGTFLVTFNGRDSWPAVLFMTTLIAIDWGASAALAPTVVSSFGTIKSFLTETIGDWLDGFTTNASGLILVMTFRGVPSYAINRGVPFVLKGILECVGVSGAVTIGLNQAGFNGVTMGFPACSIDVCGSARFEGPAFGVSGLFRIGVGAGKYAASLILASARGCAFGRLRGVLVTKPSLSKTLQFGRSSRKSMCAGGGVWDEPTTSFCTTFWGCVPVAPTVRIVSEVLGCVVVDATSRRSVFCELGLPSIGSSRAFKPQSRFSAGG